MSSLNLITAPSVEPVLLFDAKAHLRVDVSDDDAMITGLIVAAREYAETFLSRALITQTWALYCDKLDGIILLPKAPLQKLISIEYKNALGTWETISDTSYEVDPYGPRGRIVPHNGWPSTQATINGYRITFKAGFGDTEHYVPTTIRQAILTIVAHFYENREAYTQGQLSVVPMAAEMLLWPYRILDL